MALAVEGMLQESRDHYQRLRRQLTGRLLLAISGTLVRRRVGHGEYIYLRTSSSDSSDGRRDVYLGKAGSVIVHQIKQALEKRKNWIKQIRQAKHALQLLGASRMAHDTLDFDEQLRDILVAFDEQGAWEAGLELVGSWCMKVYSIHYGVGLTPIRTMDVDFAIRLNPTTKNIDLGEILKDLGFEESYNMADGTISYVSGDLKVEFLAERRGDGRSRKTTPPNIPELGIAPQPLPFLGLLLDNKVELQARDLGRVRVPSVPAFFCHKLIVAQERRQASKATKDYLQVEAVAALILRHPEMREDVRQLLTDMPNGWRDRVVKSYGSMQGHDLQATATLSVLQAVDLIKPGPSFVEEDDEEGMRPGM